MLIGHSQGGIIASRLSSDPAFNGVPGTDSGYHVANIITFGPPIEPSDPPPPPLRDCPSCTETVVSQGRE